MVKKSRVANATNTLLYDDNVHLLDGSTVISTEDKASTDTWPLATDAPVAFYYGADNEAWGATLTPTLLNAGTLGVGFSVYTTGGNVLALAGVYYMEVEIYYDLDDRSSIGYDESTGFFVISPGAGLDGSGRFQFGGSQLLLPATTGTAPIVQSSTTLNTNLNADLLDGHHWSEISTGPYNTTAINLILTSAHHWVKVTAACTITLPTAVGLAGREYIITATADNVIVDGNGSETIDGEATQTLSANDTIQVKSDGAAWWII
jgi:hypothetical protein